MPGAKAGHPETAMADAAKHRKGRRTATDIAASERCFKMRVSRHAIVLSRSQRLDRGDGRWQLLRLRTRALWFWKEPCSSVPGRAQARPIRRAQRCIQTDDRTSVLWGKRESGGEDRGGSEVIKKKKKVKK